MKIDILSSVDGVVIPNKNKNLSNDDKFKSLLSKVTDDMKPLKKEDNENKVNREKSISNKSNDDKHVTNKGKEEARKKTSVEKDNSRIIEEKSSDDIGEKIDEDNINQLMFLITALGNKINESIKPLIEELNIESQNLVDLNLLEAVTGDNEEVIQLETLKSKDNNEFINGFNKMLLNLKGNEVIDENGKFNLKEFVENKDFLGNDNVTNVIEGVDKLVGFLDEVASLRSEFEENTFVDINNKHELEGLNNLIDKITTVKESLSDVKETLSELSDSLKSVVKENKNLGKEVAIDETINAVESEKLDKSKEATFETSNGANEEKFSEEDKDEVLLNRIIGKDNNENKFLVPNKFIEFTITSVDDVKQGIDIKTFSIDTAKNIKFMVNNSLKEMVVKVNPGNLGEVTIKLSMVGNEVKANISTASKEVYSFINANEIKSALGNENLKVSEVNISLYQDDTTFFRNEGGFNESNRERSNKSYNNNDEFITLEDNSIEEVSDISSLDIIV